MVAVLGFSLTGCVSGSSENRIQSTQKLAIKGLVFKNLSNYPVDKVTLKVAATHKFISCGYIARSSECSTTFPLKAYQGNSVSVTWVQADEDYIRNDIYIQPEPYIDLAKPAYVVITFDQQRNIKAEFIQ